MTGRHEMQDTVARALCENSTQPCNEHAAYAGLAVTALVLAGYLPQPDGPGMVRPLPRQGLRASVSGVRICISDVAPCGEQDCNSCFPPLTDDGAGASPAATSADPLDPTAQAGQTNGTPAPSSPLPRRFELYRHSDITGLTGTGVVAWGAQWPDGTASLRWGGKHPSTVAWANVERIIAVHGHQGSTELRWLDGGS